MTVKNVLTDDKTRTKLDGALEEVTAHLWALDCQTCGRPLGAAAPALAVEDLGSSASAVLHHPGCRKPGWNDEGAVLSTSRPLLTYLTNAFLIPVTRDGGATRQLQPTVLVNPSMELVTLRPSQQGWAVGTVELYRQLGLVPMGEELRVDDPVEGAAARLTATELRLDLPGPIGGPWTVTVNDTFAGEVRKQRGVMLGVTTALHPGQVRTLAELAAPMQQGQVAMGWIPLD